MSVMSERDLERHQEEGPRCDGERLMRLSGDDPRTEWLRCYGAAMAAAEGSC